VLGVGAHIRRIKKLHLLGGSGLKMLGARGH
jgi:hypothetical protein